MPTVLEKIVATKRGEIEHTRRARSLDELRRQADAAAPPRDFFAAVTAPGRVHLIAEVKKASPSKGVIRADFDPVAIATTYAAHGASAISVLTDAPYFQGDLAYLQAIRQAVDLPLLRKDFILDEYQVVEARAAGADAVLLIAECLDAATLTHLHDCIKRWGMTPLVELYEPDNLAKVLACGARLVGVNNRNLHTFEVDLGHTLRLRERIPQDRCVVGESGIGTAEDVARLGAGGVQAVLVGETLMRSADVGRAVDELLALASIK